MSLVGISHASRRLYQMIGRECVCKSLLPHPLDWCSNVLRKNRVLPQCLVAYYSSRGACLSYDRVRFVAS